jgi:predicted deacylase
MNGRTRLQVDLDRLPRGRHRFRLERGGIGFEVFVWRGAPGPVLLVNAGTHGDEYEGPALLLDWARKWRPRVLRGALVLVPVLNEAAFAAGQRRSPRDGLDLARIFPGRAKGRPSERLARLFDRELLAQATHYLDLHSAGAAYELLPWVAYCTNVPPELQCVQRDMAACFDRYWRWGGPLLPGRTLSAARERGIPAITTECRGAGGIRAADLAAIDLGLRRLLAHLGCHDERLPVRRRQRVLVSRAGRDMLLQEQNLAPSDGFFLPRVRVGEVVRRGQVIGEVAALEGGSARVRADRTGRIVNLRRRRSVARGDSLATTVPI